VGNGIASRIGHSNLWGRGNEKIPIQYDFRYAHDEAGVVLQQIQQ